MNYKHQVFSEKVFVKPSVGDNDHVLGLIKNVMTDINDYIVVALTIFIYEPQICSSVPVCSMPCVSFYWCTI